MSATPNVVLIVLDDLGFAQLGCFGGDIDTPHLDRLAAEGLRFRNFHVTAMCSPTRACLLTGRNHHAVGMGFVADLPTHHPGYTARIPPTAAMLPRLLGDAGYGTMAVGKWHLVRMGERTGAAPLDQWPLGAGFDRYYGFLGGDTSHWSPHLVRDTTYVDPPERPGYHLTEDLADEAIRAVLGHRHAAPDAPFFLYLATGAPHAPHHVAPDWVQPYRGRFDEGWDVFRERAFARQVAAGVVPPGTTLTERPSWVPAWSELGPAERELFARMHEVYAAFVTHTDAQIGRVLKTLDELGQADDTLVLVCSDNGASAEGGQVGTWNEHRFTNRLPESVEGNRRWLGDWGGPRTYPHYAWGWAWAGNTPFRLWKRYTWLGGTRTPLLVRWPSAIPDPGAVRSHLAHATDVFATVLDAAGVPVPATVDGVAQQPVDGRSLVPALRDGLAAAPRRSQYFELLGSRAMIEWPWKATTDHVATGVEDEERLLRGSRSFDDDHWALFRLDEDFAEAHDVSAEHPDVVALLAARWQEEAERNHVLPLSDSLVGRIVDLVPAAHPPEARTVLRPGGGPLSDEAIPRMLLGFRLEADVDAPPHAEGVLFAIGDSTNGVALVVCGGRLRLLLSAAGEPSRAEAGEALSPGRHRLFATATPDADGVALAVGWDDEVRGTGRSAVALPLVWQHGGAAVMLGRDRGMAVAEDYASPFPWSGRLHEVVVEVPDVLAIPSEDDARMAMHQD